MSRTRSPIPPHDASYTLEIKGPVNSYSGATDFFESGPYRTFSDTAWKLSRMCFETKNTLNDAQCRIIEHGGECRTWTRNKHGEFVLDPIDRIEQTDPQLKLIGGEA